MRTLHADLTTAQRATTGTPYLEVVLTNRARTITDTYTTVDATNRILSVQHADGRTGGYIPDVSENYFISIVIHLQNSDGTLSSKEYRGYRLYVRWGFSTSSGNRYAPNQAPHIIIQQRLLSEEGINILELRAVPLWEYLRLLPVNGLAESLIAWNDPNGRDDVATTAQILQTATGGALAESIKVDDGGVFTTIDPTVIIQTAPPPNYLLSASILPTNPVINDAVYFGLDVTFDNISIHIRTAGVNLIIRWEYWNS